MLKEKALYIAILASAALHIFWMSLVTVVVPPGDVKSVKFSNVFFLGPILEKAHLELSTRTAESPLLERKYLEDIAAVINVRYTAEKEALAEPFFTGRDPKISNDAKALVRGEKPDLGYVYEAEKTFLR